MNIYEFCEKFRISLGKAEKMRAAGVLLLDAGESKYGAVIRRQLSKGMALTVAQLLAMIEDSSILNELGRYAEKAQLQLAALGDVRNEVAPREVAAYISDAARRDKEAIGILVGWIKQILPAEPVTHDWIAVRLLLGLQANVRKFDIPRIKTALFYCRRCIAFEGWWRIEKRGSRPYTLYQRPEISFDL